MSNVFFTVYSSGEVQYARNHFIPLLLTTQDAKPSFESIQIETFEIVAANLHEILERRNQHFRTAIARPPDDLRTISLGVMMMIGKYQSLFL